MGGVQDRLGTVNGLPGLGKGVKDGIRDGRNVGIRLDSRPVYLVIGEVDTVDARSDGCVWVGRIRHVGVCALYDFF
jgi:hypothetical protein